MYRWLVPTVVLPAYEALSGRRSWTEMRRLQELQWRPAGELEARAMRRVRELLAHAVAHVPYYRDLFRGSDVHPEEIRTPADLGRVPVTTKAALRDNFPARTVADDLPRRRFAKGLTSGSTGAPFQFYTDRAADANRHGSYLFFLDWAGAALWDTRIVIAYHATLPREPVLRRAARRLLLGEQLALLSGVDLSAATLRARIRRLPGRRRYFIQAYPSYATRLAATLLEENVELTAYPRVVITMTETLTAVNADAIARAFRCRVVNHYSTWEILHLAQSCPDNPELLHVNSERAIVQVVRADGTLAGPGERGRVFLTDLSNMVMPFINYDIGDWAVAGPPCPCGRGWPTLRDLDGRVGEVIETPDGKIIAPGALTRRLTRQVVGYVWEYQAVQPTPDAVVLRVVPSRRFSPGVATGLQANLQEFLGPTVRVTVETVERIPVEASGKRLIIKPVPPTA
jgi:phenylacetate-CoA ligase